MFTIEKKQDLFRNLMHQVKILIELGEKEKAYDLYNAAIEVTTKVIDSYKISLDVLGAGLNVIWEVDNQRSQTTEAAKPEGRLISVDSRILLDIMGDLTAIDLINLSTYKNKEISQSLVRISTTVRNVIETAQEK